MSDQFTHPYEDEIRWKCCNCKRIIPKSQLEIHREPDVNGLVHTVVPITKCLFCHGCDK